MEMLDSLYDAIVDNMKSADFTVSDKYKVKQEELGINKFHFFFFSLLIPHLFLQLLLTDKV